MNAIGSIPASFASYEGTAIAAPSTPLDDTTETTPEILGKDATAPSAVAPQSQDDLRLERMRANFNLAQKERAELLREADVLRDMETQQMKLDDENLKKWIALI